MEGSVFSDVHQLCRICLVKGEKMFSLNSGFSEKPKHKSEETLSILSMIEHVMSQKVITANTHPSSICGTCKPLLKIAYDLKIVFFKSQATLQDFFEHHLIKTESPEQAELFSELPVEARFQNNCDSIVETNDEVIFEVDTDCKDKPVSKKRKRKKEAQTSLAKKQRKDDIVKKQSTGCNSLNNTKRPRIRVRKETQLLCSLCGKISENRSKARYHKRTHEERRFKCELCSKKFIFQMNYNVHMKSHIQVRDKLCTVCGKTFCYENALAYHMRIHQNERNYVCTYCKKTFYMPSTLKRHVRIHTNDRPYSCSFCEKRFRSNGEKKKHEMLHTGERPHKCQYCDKTYVSKFNLSVHLMAHVGPHQCDFCTKNFIELEFLKKHVKQKHKHLVETEENTVDT